MIKPEDIRIINTISPRGKGEGYGVNFTLNVRNKMSIGSAKVWIEEDEIMNTTERDKPKLVLETIKEALFGEEKK